MTMPAKRQLTLNMNNIVNIVHSALLFNSRCYSTAPHSQNRVDQFRDDSKTTKVQTPPQLQKIAENTSGRTISNLKDTEICYILGLADAGMSHSNIATKCGQSKTVVTKVT